MRSFGKAIRNTLPALGLGLMGVTGLATVMAVTAPAAYAQKSSKEFVEAYNAATTALSAKSYSAAAASADKAQPHAKTNQEKLALEGIRVQAYYATKNHAGVVKAIESSFALGGLAPETVKSYKQLLAAAYADLGNQSKAVALTKEYIDAYGGTTDQMGWLAQNALRAKNYSEAVNYAQKAIDQARKGGQKPKEAWHKIILGAHYEAKDMTSYYTALERVALDYPSEQYWRQLVERATKEPKFKRDDTELDMFRTLDAAGVPLKTAEKLTFAELAFIRGSAVEAEKILEPMFKAGTVGGAGDANADRVKRLYVKIQEAAKADKAGGLASSESDAAKKPTGDQLIVTGEAYMGAGDYQKAADLIKRGIDKGQINEDAIALAQLRLGIAQYKGGQKDEARKTWGAISADNGARALARSWILISRS